VENYTHTLIIKTSPEKVYEAINTEKGLASWWTQTEIYPEVGGTATFSFEKDVYVVMKIAKLIPNKEVVWKCVEQYFPTKGTDKTNEWVGTTVRFDIAKNADITITLSFVHEGLTSQLFSYKKSNEGWNYFLGSLKKYLETGKGTPYKAK